MCGGDIELSSDKTIGVCDSCGCNTTLLRIDDEQKVGLFNRGNTLRMRGEFDKAAAVFERIIEQDETDAEAHWCLALCRYGIEYVEDSKNGERIPTCNRTSYDLFLNDVDYVAAIEHSDSHAASVYTTEAKRIAEIQRAILAISKQEEPFDVFICYKETTDGGSRTKDSTLAQDIYYELTNAGYKIFFSRITLEDKLGTEYEPYIFAALNSAKVMVVVGTSADNFNAVWVKNEWSRFLSIMKTDRSRMLIPCYRDMDPYDLPDELAMLQSQDMSKIGFLQDIMRGIKKILESTTAKTASKTVSEIAPIASLERLIQNSNTYLRLNNYPAAQEVFSRVTKEYPEDYRGWWGLIICETKGLQVVANDSSSLNTWFKYVKQLSTHEVFVPLETEYVAYNKIVANSDAVNEMSAVNRAINSLNANIKTFVERRKKVEQQKNQRSSAYSNQSTNDDNAVSNAQRTISINEECLAKHRQTTTIASFFVGGGVLLVLTGSVSGWLIFWGLVSGFIGFCVWSSSGNADGYSKQISGAQSQLRTAKETKASNRAQYDKDIREFESQIANINAEIAQAEGRIAECKKYLAHGKVKMSEMFFAQRCKSIGVNQQFDIDTEHLRKVALGQGASDSTDTLTSSFERIDINCPLCKERLTANKSELINGNIIVCHKCGNNLELNFENYQDGGSPYEITCPACGGDFSVSKEVLNSGSANCPTCGTHLEFDTN